MMAAGTGSRPFMTTISTVPLLLYAIATALTSTETLVVWY